MSNASSPLFSRPPSPVATPFFDDSPPLDDKKEKLRKFEANALALGYYYSNSILDRFNLVQNTPNPPSNPDSDSSGFGEDLPSDISPDEISRIFSDRKVCSAQISVENVCGSKFRIVFFDLIGDRNRTYSIHSNFSVRGLRGFADERVVFITPRGMGRIGFRFADINGCFLKMRIDLGYCFNVKIFKNQSFSLDPLTQNNSYL